MLCVSAINSAIYRFERADELRVSEHEALVDVMGEIVYGALRRLLLRRIAGRAVVLGKMGQHHLCGK